MAPLTGTCLCKHVSMTIMNPEPVIAEGLEVCRCTDCRQFTGALASPFLGADTANVQITGKDAVSSYAKTSDRGNTYTRHWCDKCGSCLYDMTCMREGKRMVVHAGLFPPGSLPKPIVQIYMRSAEKWDVPMSGVPAHDTEEEE